MTERRSTMNEIQKDLDLSCGQAGQLDINKPGGLEFNRSSADSHQYRPPESVLKRICLSVRTQHLSVRRDLPNVASNEARSNWSAGEVA